MKNLLFILFAFIVFLSTACDKGDDQLCNRSSTNHDILCCKINGEDWIPGGGGSDIISPYTLQYYSDTGWFGLLAGNSINNGTLIGAIYIIANDLKFGNNSIIDNESLFHIQNDDNIYGCVYYENLDSNFDNYIFITEIDSINYFMKGEFQFSAINDCQDTIKVTDGYFDLNYFF